MAHPTPDDLALIALGEDVATEVTAHVADCRACYAEIDALEQVVAIGRSLGSDDVLTAPDARVWHRVVAEVRVGQDSQTQGAVGLLEPTTTAPYATSSSAAAVSGTSADDELAARRDRSPRRRRSSLALVAAAALVVGVGGGFVLRGVVVPSTPVDSATQLNALPGWPGANGTASIEEGPGGERTLVVSMRMPPTVQVDGTLEVWISDTRAQDMQAMGTMTDDSGRFPIPTGMDMTSHPIVDVSLEPPGDTDPAHSAVSVVRGRLRV